MANFYTVVYFFTIVSMLWSPALCEDKAVAEKRREPRHLLQSKLCSKFGICGGQGGNNNYQGGYGGNHGGYNQGGYGGYQGGYNQGGYGGHQGGYYPPINIGISQSQSSSSAGGGGYGSSSYPNNYQYNGGYPNHGGYNHQQRPGYLGNGYGSYNNQFNGNYYGSEGGYGYQRPYDYQAEATNEEDYDEDYSRSAKSRD